jgi:hypothetical protein
VIYRKLLKAAGGAKGLAEIEEQVKSDIDELAEAAMEKLLAVVQAGFNLKPLDEEGQGATEAEQLKAWSDFLAYLSESKKKDETQPIWSPPTEEASSAAAASPTMSGSPSGSTAAASSTNRQP